MIQRGGAIGIEEASLVAIRDPAVRVHSSQVDLVSVAVAGHGIYGREYRKAVAPREESQVVGEHAAGDVRGRDEARPHRRIPRGDGCALRSAGVVCIRQGDVSADCSVGVRDEREACRPGECDVVDPGRRRRVVARKIAARHPTGWNRVRSGELLRPQSYLPLDAGALDVAAEAGRGRDVLGADRPRHEAGIPDDDVARPLPDRTGPKVQHLARVQEHLEQGSPQQEAATVRAGAPLGVGATPGRAVGPQVLAAGGRGATGSPRKEEEDERKRRDAAPKQGPRSPGVSAYRSGSVDSRRPCT